MLHSLHVKNLALIEEQEITFDEGLNILTGETGAGKSVLIGSINLCLGEKADRTLIREGAEYALIEMTFGVSDGALKDALSDMDITPEEDGTILIQRRLYPSRSVCRVNGETLTLSALREVASLLINIHGQNEHQTLLTKKNHLAMLDIYGGEEISELKDKVAESVSRLKSLEKQIDDNSMDERARQKEEDLTRYEISEIEAASLSEEEEERLEGVYRRMRGAEKSVRAVSEALGLTEGEDAYESGAALDLLSRALKELHGTNDADDDLKQIMAQLTDAEIMLRDAVHAMRTYVSSMSFDERTFADTEERLNVIHRLCDKYAPSTGKVSEVLDYLEERTKRLEELTDYDAWLKSLTKEAGESRKEALSYASKLSEKRSEKASELSAKMEEALRELNFPDVRFEIPVRGDDGALTENGIDETEFMISVNRGEALRPLVKIASGGELSRIMLALKTVQATDSDADAMIFDEVDAGISGKTAWKVAGALNMLSKGRQVICITHLPQIAAMADSHYYIDKEESGGRTVTRITRLNDEGCVNELARLLGTGHATDSMITNARELKELASRRKNNEES